MKMLRCEPGRGWFIDLSIKLPDAFQPWLIARERRRPRPASSAAEPGGWLIFVIGSLIMLLITLASASFA